MVVYVEWVIADNMFFDCLVLYVACKTLRQKAVWWKIILGGVVGTVCAFGAVLLSRFWSFAVKLLCLPIMSAVCTNKQVLMHMLLVALYTFLLGGIIVGIFFLKQQPLDVQGGSFVYSANVPLGVYGLAVAVFVWLTYIFGKYVNSQRKLSKYYRKVVVHANKDITAVGYVDSGNTLTFCSVPVCFVSTKNLQLERYFSQNRSKAENVLLQTVSGKSNVLALPCELTVNGVRQKVYLAQSQTNFYADILLNAFLEIDYENVETITKTY